MPYFIELALKARTKFKSESFGTPTEDGLLKAPDKIASMTHISMRLFKTEKRTVLGLLVLELMLAAVVIILL